MLIRGLVALTCALSLLGCGPPGNPAATGFHVSGAMNLDLTPAADYSPECTGGSDVGDVAYRSLEAVKGGHKPDSYGVEISADVGSYDVPPYTREQSGRRTMSVTFTGSTFALSDHWSAHGKGRGHISMADGGKSGEIDIDLFSDQNGQVHLSGGWRCP